MQRKQQSEERTEMCVDHITPRYKSTEFNIATCLTCLLFSSKQASRMMVEKNNVLSLHLEHNQVTGIKATHIQKGHAKLLTISLVKTSKWTGEY